MGWRKALITFAASQKRIQKEVDRQHRQQIRQALQIAKAEEDLYISEQKLELAEEIKIFWEYIVHITNLHKECSSLYDWISIAKTYQPIKPTRKTARQQKAQRMIDEYTPSFTDRLFGRSKVRQSDLRFFLEKAIIEDEKEFEAKMQQYQIELREWSIFNQTAQLINNRNIEGYKKAIEIVNPFLPILELESIIESTFIDVNSVAILFYVNNEQVIPTIEKNIDRSGNITELPISQVSFNQYHLTYICSAVLRIGRELFAILPAQQVFLTVVDDFVIPQTGNQRRYPILSVLFTRSLFETLNFEQIDCVQAMNNFNYRIDFDKKKGFTPIEPLEIKSL